VDEYLSEREQVDRIRQWWKENGAWIIVGIGGGVLALAGWNWWQGYQLERAEQASAIYSVVAEAAVEGRLDEVRAGVDRLEAGHGSSPYLQHAGLCWRRRWSARVTPKPQSGNSSRCSSDTRDPTARAHRAAAPGAFAGGAMARKSARGASFAASMRGRSRRRCSRWKAMCWPLVATVEGARGLSPGAGRR
jgi:hypothetical protein